MATSAFDGIHPDPLTISVARSLDLANRAAAAQGIDPARSLVTITEEASPPNRLWRIHYGPRDFVHRRGGDLIVLVDENARAVQQIIHRQ